MDRVRTLFIASIVLMALGSASARAQDASERARELFERGTEAHQNRRFTEAITHLRASLELYDNPGTAFNLANAMRGAARTTEAIEIFDLLLAGRYGELSADEDGEARQLREVTRAELATLRVTVIGPTVAQIRLDGERQHDAGPEGPATYFMDAGAHVMDVRAEGYQPLERRFDLASGQSEDVEIELETRLALSEPVAPVDRTEVWEEPWLWIVLGVIAVGGVALALALVFSDQASSALFTDDEFGVTATLRIAP